MTRTRRVSKSGTGRWIVYVGAVFAVAWLATQLFYFAQIAIWNYVNPQSTAFMRSDAWRLSADRSDLSIQHTWMPYDQISRNLKRAI
ncbi:MAG TPA: monofunctional biosynthetic peptidoglycan transglycosylase, partial [Paraburkholderia sp.]